MRDWLRGAVFPLGVGERLLDFVGFAARGVLSPVALSAFAAVISAYAAWVSYQTSLRSLQVAESAQRFAENVYRQQIELGAPSFAIAGGELARGLGADYLGRSEV